MKHKAHGEPKILVFDVRLLFFIKVLSSFVLKDDNVITRVLGMSARRRHWAILKNTVLENLDLEVKKVISLEKGRFVAEKSSCCKKMINRFSNEY